MSRLMAICVCMFGSWQVCAAAEPGTQYQLNVPAQPVYDALKAFAAQTNLQVVYYSDVAQGMASPGVSGELNAGAALKKILEGTGLTFQFLNDRTVAIRGGRDKDAGIAPPARSQSGEPLQLARAGNFPVSGSTAQQAASAQSDEQQNSRTAAEIVVTAQKRLERLQDVPVPVTAVRADELTASNQLRLKDYYTRIPGLSLVQTGNGSQPIVAIRGVVTGSSQYPTVGIVVDEVPYGGSVILGASAPDIDPGDLARVEVLRGPQGTLYGAASMGGLLKFVTVDPSIDAFSGRVQVGAEGGSYGKDPGYSLRGSVNIPLSDTFAMRASGFTLRDHGYVDNIRTGQRDINQTDTDGGRLSLLWRPSDDFSLKLGALIQDSQRQGTEDVDTALPGRFQQALLRDTGIYDRKSEVYSALMNARLGSVELTSVTGYNIDDVKTNADASIVWGPLAIPGYGVNAVQQPYIQRNSKFTQEIRALVPLTDRIRWLFGAFYTRENLDSISIFLPSDPVTGASVTPSLTSFWYSGVHVVFKERSAFTNFTFDITDRFDVQVGGRFTEGKQDYSLTRRGSLALLFLGSDPADLPLTDSSDTNFTYLITPRLKLTPHSMVYARLASGYRPGGPNGTCGAPGVPCEFNPDTTRNYELGIKGDLFDRALSIDASLYYIDWRDIQLSLLINGFGYTGNASRARSQGAEVSMELRPRRGLSIAGWVAWNAAELAEDFPPPPASSVRGRDGDRLPFSSRFSGNLSIDQEFPVGAGFTASVGGSVSYVGDRVGNFMPTLVRANFPAYTQADLRAGLRYGTWELNAFLTNITDERGVLRNGLDAYRPTFVTYIRPRTVGLSLAKVF